MPPGFGRFERAISATIGVFLGTIFAIITALIFGGNVNDAAVVCLFVKTIFLSEAIVGIYSDPTEDIIYMQQQQRQQNIV